VKLVDIELLTISDLKRRIAELKHKPASAPKSREKAGGVPCLR